MNTNYFEFEAAYGTATQLPPSTLPEVTFAGRSNVGKSSLLNCLLRRKNLARVSGTPGKTVTVNFFSDGNVRLADLPGYGYAKRSQSEIKRFAGLMEGYFQQQRNIALVVQLIDLRHAPSKDDQNMLAFLREMKLPYIIVLTKADKLKPMAFAKRMEEVAAELGDTGVAPPIAFSSETGRGRAELIALIEEIAA